MRLQPVLSLLLALLLVAMPGCKARSGSDGRLKVGLVTDVGGLNDGSFNFLAGQGLERAKKDLGVKTAVVESKQLTDYEKNLALLASVGYDLVISVGFMMGDATRDTAERFPKTKFGIIDFRYPEVIPNVSAITFAEEQASFLAGALAALQSKSGTVGFVGGMDVPVIHRFLLGYEAGAKEARPGTKVLTGYTGNFDDPAKGREVAMAQYQHGADIVFHASGRCGLGVFDAAKASRRLAIGVDADQYKEAPEYVLSSALKRVDLAVYDVIEKAKTGKFSGENRKLTLRDGAVGLAPFYDHDAKVSPATRARIEDFEARLAAGRIEIPLGKDE